MYSTQCWKLAVTDTSKDRKTVVGVFECQRSTSSTSKNKMGPPIVTKLTSDFVWQRFEIKKNEKDPSDLSKVICTLCKTVMSRGLDPSKWGVYTLKRHYTTKHPIEFAELPSVVRRPL